MWARKVIATERDCYNMNIFFHHVPLGVPQLLTGSTSP